MEICLAVYSCAYGLILKIPSELEISLSVESYDKKTAEN